MKVQYNFLIGEKLLNKVRAYAKQEETSVTSVLIEAVKNHLKTKE